MLYSEEEGGWWVGSVRGGEDGKCEGRMEGRGVMGSVSFLISILTLQFIVIILPKPKKEVAMTQHNCY